jgi:dolichyl-phosphate beta-glucosyltransferase
MQHTHLSVVIPAYNEEKRIPNTLNDVMEYLKSQPYTSEVLVVDDGSKDGTAEAVRRDPNNVELIQYPDGQNRGKGYAVRYGMMKATGKYRVFMDADNSTTINHVEQFFPLFEEGYDVVIGSRDIKGANVAVAQSWIKELAGKLGNLFIRFMAVRGIHDTQAGFKMFTDRAADTVFPLLTIDRWGFDVEILAVACHKKLAIKEMPITWVNDEESKVKASAYLQVFGEVVRVRINLIKRKYNGAQKKENV